MKFLKYFLIGLAVLLLGGFVINLIGGLLGIAIPVLVIAGIGYVVYKIATRNKSLTGGGKPLP